jgi:hypothetical protein
MLALPPLEWAQQHALAQSLFGPHGFAIGNTNGALRHDP